jgi:DNA polymerase-1
VDLEANGLTPTKIWIVVFKDIQTGEINVFKPYLLDQVDAFKSFAEHVSLWVGHNFLNYDRPALARVLGVVIPPDRVLDTLVVSRLTDATRSSHSLESYGSELKQPKLHTDLSDWSQWDPRFEERCRGDVETNFLHYKKFERFLTSPSWKDAIETEHFIATLCKDELNANGFSFNYSNAVELRSRIEAELSGLEAELTKAFPVKVVFEKEVNPRATKHGTINRTSIPRCLGNDYTVYSPDAPFSLISYQTFNPGSTTQRIERLWEAGWQPINKTDGHSEALRELRTLNRKRRKTAEDQVAINSLGGKLVRYATYGWKADEENLSTLPETAPQGAHSLVRWMILSNRISTLTSWMACVRPPEPGNALPDYRVHGNFNHILPWTHRMSHSEPNLGNVPKFVNPQVSPYSDEMRALWQAGPGQLLVGVDAESIQLRIFGHYIDDEEFINSLLRGKKEDGTDPHSVNQRALGTPCKSRDAAKTFIYAWLLGAGISKIAAILGCSKEEAEEAGKNFLNRYPGLRFLKEKVIPEDAARGYFQGFDGRYVKIIGDDVDARKHFTLAGYLQCGEAVIMKRAVQIWYPKLKREGVPFKWVNFVHDEWQTEVPDLETAQYVARTQADAIREVGDALKLRCPMAGSWFSEHGTEINGEKWAIGRTWMETH